MTNPYFPAKPGEPILAQTWNDLQIQIREHIHNHAHTGAAEGRLLTGASVDPSSTLSVKQLDTSLKLTVRSVDVFETLSALGKRADRLDAEKLPLTGGTLAGPLTVKGAVTANRLQGENALTLNDYQTLNLTSNVYLSSPPNDRDAWIYLDGGVTHNWGLYHRQIDSPVKGLSQNSIGFIGASTLKASISLQDGSSYFAGKMGIGTTSPGIQLHIQGASAGPLLQDGYDRPGLAITGHYPQLTLFSNIANTNHGPALRLGSYTDATATTHKHWVIGTSGRNSTFLDIGFSEASDPNPHAGIRNHNGRTVLTLQGGGNVGIGTTDPQGRLDVRVAGANAWDRFVVNTTNAWGDGNTQYVTIGAGGASGIMFWNPHVTWYAPEARASIRYGRSGGVSTGSFWDVGVRSNNAFSFALNGGDHKLWLSGDGNLGIGTTNPQRPLHITRGGGIRIDDPSIGGRFFQIFFESGNGTIIFYHQNGNGQFMRQDGNWFHNSDVALKENVAGLSGVLDKVMRLRPVSFDWKAGKLPGLGFIAQEVEPVFPELIAEHEGPETGKLKGLPYSAFGVLAIAALQELKGQYDARIRGLEAQLAALKGA
jgi:hypothetical protein